MSDGFEAVQVSEHVFWVGAIDWNIRDFHGYSTLRGSTYNAYLVRGEKLALVDTVKRAFAPEMLARIRSVVGAARIDSLILNHAEVDHSGSLPEAIAALQPEQVFASKVGVGALQDHFHLAREITGVADGSTLDLGGVTLTFLDAKMLHWPESMFTYVAEDKTLLPNDAFGMHLASGERFADQLPESVLEEEAGKYFANILTPFTPLILKQLERVKALGVPIDTIAPSHGPVWRKPGWIVERYARWSVGEATDRVVVVYDTMWGSTEKMALGIAQGLISEGVPVQVMSLKANDRSQVVAQLLGAGAVVVGSPTLNNNVFPTIADLLVYMRGLRPKKVLGAAFGSYGWSGEAHKQIAEALTGMKLELVGEPLGMKYVPDAAKVEQCIAFGRQIAAAVRGKLAQGSAGG
jgi:flavorubredoxin